MGAVTVTTGSTTLTSPQTFKVKPKITTFSPSSGSTGTLVTINGSGFIQATAVKFGTVLATTFTVVSDSQVTADVPSGLSPGRGDDLHHHTGRHGQQPNKVYRELELRMDGGKAPPGR